MTLRTLCFKYEKDSIPLFRGKKRLFFQVHLVAYYRDVYIEFAGVDPLLELGSNVVAVSSRHLYGNQLVLVFEELVYDRVILASFAVLSTGFLLYRR